VIYVTEWFETAVVVLRKESALSVVKDFTEAKAPFSAYKKTTL